MNPNQAKEALASISAKLNKVDELISKAYEEKEMMDIEENMDNQLNKQ